MKIFSDSTFRKYTIAGLLIAGLGLFINTQFSSKKPVLTPEGFVKVPKKERIDGMIEFEYEKTRDPNTGEVPRERLYDAIEYTNALIEERRNSGQRFTQFRWQERGPNNVSGRTRALCVDLNDPTGNTIWTGGVAGGIWVTRNMLDNRPDWTPIGDFFENVAIGTIAQDPAEPKYIYVGTGEGWFNGDAVRGFGIWRTADGGDTWEHLQQTRNSNFYYVNKMLVTPEGDVYAATNAGAYRSVDKGETWQRIGDGRTTDLIQASNGILYSTVSGSGVFRSQSGNAGSWQRLTMGLPSSGFGRVEIAAAQSNPSVIYALFAAGNGNALGIYRSDNGGDSWQTLFNPPAFGMDNFARGQAWYDLIIAVDPNNPDRVFIGGIDILVSSNGGANWTQITQWFGGGGIQYTHADQHNIVFHHGSSDTIYFTNDGGIYRTTNGSSSMPNSQFVSHGYNVTQFYACDIHPEERTDWFLAGSQDNGTQLFRSEAMNNTTRVTGGDGAFVHIDQKDPNIQISSYIYNNYYITNSSWSPGGTTNITIGSNSGYFINPTGYDSDAKILYCSYNGGWYAMVKNVGSTNTIDSVNIATFAGGSVSSVTISPSIPNRVYFGMNSGAVVRVDDANSSSPQAFQIRSGNGFVSCVAVDDENEDNILVTYSNYGIQKIFRSSNGGSSWAACTGNLPDMPVRWAVFNPDDKNQVLIATEVGIWSTSQLDGSLTQWEPANDGLGNTRVDMIKIRKSDKYLIAATHGRGLYSSTALVQPRAIIKTEQLISYVNTEIQFVDNSIGEYESRIWEFGDGSTSVEANPIHTFLDTGLFEVKLILDNGLATSSLVRILPDKPLPYTKNETGYSGSFEQFQGDFGSINIRGSQFELGNSAIAAKAGTNSGNYAWVLGLNEAFYTPGTIAALYTPNFDMTDIGIYELSFHAKHDISPFDGMQVEFSGDNGITWSLLGRSGIKDWYNFGSTAPGGAFEFGQPYFSGRQATFKKYKLNISELGGSGFVAFRFVFRSGNAGVFPGIAIDDFEIQKVLNVSGTVVTEFTPSFTNDRKIRVNWSTRPEFYCKEFTVELSENGRDYQQLAIMTGNNFSLETNNYQFTTALSRNRDIYYLRLYVVNEEAAVDYQNNFYTEPVVLKRNIPSNQVFHVFPTITRTHVGITFTDIIREETTLRLFSLDGKLVKEGVSIPNSPYLQYDVPQLSPGVYVLFLEIKNLNYMKSIKVVVP